MEENQSGPSGLYFVCVLCITVLLMMLAGLTPVIYQALTDDIPVHDIHIHDVQIRIP